MVGGNFMCTFVYGATDKNVRMDLFKQVEDIGQKIDMPWIILGDFNCIENW